MQKIKKDTSLFDGVARLVAQEDLTIVTGNYRTAAIHLQHRIIMLPEWSGVDSDIAEMFRAHEVSHALHSPTDFSHQAVEKLDGVSNKTLAAGLKDCINICEDVRIETMIKSKFPGYIAIFERAYDTLFAREFFGTTDMAEIADNYLFHDRLNVLLKMGSAYRGQLLKDRTELDFYFELVEATTFDEILVLSKRLYDMVKAELKEKNESEAQQAPSQGAESEEGEEGESGESAEPEEGEEGEESSGSAPTFDEDDVEDGEPESGEGEEDEESDADSTEGDGQDGEGEESEADADSDDAEEGEESEADADSEDAEEGEGEESGEGEDGESGEESDDDGEDSDDTPDNISSDGDEAGEGFSEEDLKSKTEESLRDKMEQEFVDQDAQDATQIESGLLLPSEVADGFVIESDDLLAAFDDMMADVIDHKVAGNALTGEVVVRNDA